MSTFEPLSARRPYDEAGRPLSCDLPIPRRDRVPRVKDMMRHCGACTYQSLG